MAARCHCFTSLPVRLAAARPGSRAGPVCTACFAGDGLCRAGWSASYHWTVHHGRLPGCTRTYWSITIPGAWARFVAGPHDRGVILPLAAGDVEYSTTLAGMPALMVGLICVGAWIARLGFVSDLLSMHR